MKQLPLKSGNEVLIDFMRRRDQPEGREEVNVQPADEKPSNIRVRNSALSLFVLLSTFSISYLIYDFECISIPYPC